MLPQCFCRNKVKKKPWTLFIRSRWSRRGRWQAQRVVYGVRCGKLSRWYKGRCSRLNGLHRVKDWSRTVGIDSVLISMVVSQQLERHASKVGQKDVPSVEEQLIGSYTFSGTSELAFSPVLQSRIISVKRRRFFYWVRTLKVLQRCLSADRATPTATM